MKIVVEKEIIKTRLDDEMAILNQKNGKYFSLNKTGIRIFELLQECGETEKVINIMLDEYSIDESLLRRDFDNIMSQMLKAELVVLS
ncbi:MAG: PqqD family protein [Clostridia bacterium]|nr:PqqD family protein [Clostridia bacterium]